MGVVDFGRAKIGDEAFTWKRADGDEIGDYGWVTDDGILDDRYDDPAEYTRQRWQLVSEDTVILPEPTEDD